ncbi:hypothetical protein ACERK3_07120 [Phycisphaerales bacterium AB-hyl4]|uniref:Beta-galactosidase trimerisation domain-containing protein n=1 Tax=Natronomicrosphaera hydrolytica TaxID=3242702 RepID=A0ABV4U396_9BACT
MTDSHATHPRSAVNAPLYAIRRTLPPWCFESRLEELLTFCRDACVDEVILKVDAEEFSQGMPTVAWVCEYVSKLKQARDALHKVGVTFSLNPWVTQGHIDRGRDLRARFPDFHWMVGHDGVVCRAQACPRCERFQHHAVELWKLYATLEPAVIWIEDDIRTFNHQPAAFGCFCPLHLGAFARRVGVSTLTREQLVDALLAPGEAHPWRRAWFDFQRDTMHELGGVLADAVHGISPATRIGLMSSGPANHCLDGRDWRGLAKRMSGGPGVIHSRPTLGNYTEGSAVGLYDSAAQIHRTRHVLPKGTIEQTEVENVPFTGYAKSRSFTMTQVALSVARGCAGATLNLFDHLGSSLSVDPMWATMLREARPMLERLRHVMHGDGRSQAFDGTFQGVQVLHHERASDVRRLSSGARYEALIPVDGAFEASLNMLGFPTTYDCASVVATDGQMLDAFDDASLEAVLRGGMFIDAAALAVLHRRGFGELVGAEPGPFRTLNVGHVTAAEAMTDVAFGGAVDRYLTLTLPDLLGQGRYVHLEPADSARVVSEIVDQNRQHVAPMLTLFENKWGGRIAILPLEMATAFGTPFLHPYRQVQLAATLRWLGRERPAWEVSGGVYPLASVAAVGGRRILTLFNLSRDDWPSVTWNMPVAPDKVQAVSAFQGGGGELGGAAVQMTTIPGGSSVCLKTTLPFGRPLTCVVDVEQPNG